MDDLISRKAAIDALCAVCGKACDKSKFVYNAPQDEQVILCPEHYCLCTLPSAQPEIIRCTECKHYREYDSEYVENAVVVQCMADRYPISETIPDGWFCAGAERKDDE